VKAPGPMARACAAVLAVQALAVWAAAWAAQPASLVCDANGPPLAHAERANTVVRLQAYQHP
jgi:hypothetical protein